MRYILKSRWVEYDGFDSAPPNGLLNLKSQIKIVKNNGKKII